MTTGTLSKLSATIEMVTGVLLIASPGLVSRVLLSTSPFGGWHCGRPIVRCRLVLLWGWRAGPAEAVQPLKLPGRCLPITYWRPSILDI